MHPHHHHHDTKQSEQDFFFYYGCWERIMQCMTRRLRTSCGLGQTYRLGHMGETHGVFTFCFINISSPLGNEHLFGLVPKRCDYLGSLLVAEWLASESER